MGQHRCDLKTTFAILRTSSQHQDRKLHDIVADIVERVTGHDPHHALPALLDCCLLRPSAANRAANNSDRSRSDATGLQ